MQLSTRKPDHPYGRCFHTAYLCKMGGAGFFPGMYGAMRAIFSHYQQRLPPAPYTPFDAGQDVLKVRALIPAAFSADCPSARHRSSGRYPFQLKTRLCFSCQVLIEH